MRFKRSLLASIVTLGAIGAAIAQNYTSPQADTGSNSSQGLVASSYGYLYNGATWDRQRSATSLSTVGTGVTRSQIEEGYTSSLNVTAATTIKATAGRVFKISVVVAGAAGQLCDVNGACAAANVVATVPAVVGVYDINWPFLTGIRFEPGAAQVVSISWQ